MDKDASGEKPPQHSPADVRRELLRFDSVTAAGGSLLLPGAPGKSIPCRSLSDPPRATVPKLPLPNSPQTPLRSHQPSSKSSPPGSITWAGLLH